MAAQLGAAWEPCEVLDSTGLPVCDSRRRGRSWLAGLRQIVESVRTKLLHTCGLARERLHALDGIQARWAAAVGLRNFCCWLNRQLGRPLLAFADLIDW